MFEYKNKMVIALTVFVALMFLYLLWLVVFPEVKVLDNPIIDDSI